MPVRVMASMSPHAQCSPECTTWPPTMATRRPSRSKIASTLSCAGLATGADALAVDGRVGSTSRSPAAQLTLRHAARSAGGTLMRRDDMMDVPFDGVLESDPRLIEADRAQFHADTIDGVGRRLQVQGSPVEVPRQSLQR